VKPFYSVIDEKLLRIFLKILEPLMPYVQCINAEEHSEETEVEKETSGGKNEKGDNSTTEEQSVSSGNNNGSQDKADLSGEETAQTSGDTVEDEESDEISEKTKRHVIMLYRILQGFAYDVMFSIYIVSFEI
jgi:cobalamin biosynthesis protein CobT